MLIKDKEIEGVHSKFFRKPEDSVHLKHNLLTAGTKDVSFGCKEIGNMQLGPITKARCVMLVITYNDYFPSNGSVSYNYQQGEFQIK